MLAVYFQNFRYIFQADVEGHCMSQNLISRLWSELTAVFGKWQNTTVHLWKAQSIKASVWILILLLEFIFYDIYLKSFTPQVYR